MKANPDKYHLLINNIKESFQIKIDNETVSNRKYEKLLGIKVDHELIDHFNECSHRCATRLTRNYILCLE